MPAASVTGDVWQFTTKAEQTTDEALGTKGHGFDWSNGGDQPWFSQTAETHDGDCAMQSGAIAHNQQSVLQTVVEGPGTLGFWSRVSSETADELRFSVNGTALTNWSGSGTWTQTLVAVDSGAQTAKWVYAKNASGSSGSDAAWVDQVTWEGENKVVFPVSFPGVWIAAYVWDDAAQEWIELGQQQNATEIVCGNIQRGKWYWLCIMEWDGASWNLAHGSWFKRQEGY